MLISIKEFTKPFAIMKIGIESYKGEMDLWERPKGFALTFCHIMVRVCEEHRKARLEGADYYPFGLTTHDISVLRGLDRNCREVDIFFVPVVAEADDWDWGLPDPKLISWKSSIPRYTTIIVDGKESRIPDPIRLWASDSEDYPVLLVNDPVCFESDDRITLDFDGAPCINRSTETPVEKWLEGRPTFGLFENRQGKRRCGSLSRDAIARAKLVYPYWGITRP